MDDGAKGGGLGHGQPGVVVDAAVIVVQPLVGIQALQEVAGQQVGRGWFPDGELPPAFQSGEVAVQFLSVQGSSPAVLPTWVRLWAGRGSGRGHHRLSASLKGSKTPSGMTFATGSSRVPPSSSAS